MAKPAIQVVIVNRRQSQKCDGHCGLDWSLPESVTEARRRIEASFGDRVRLEYLDLSGEGGDSSEWGERVRQQGLSLPLLLISGGVVISGEFDLRMLLDAVGAEIEIKGR